MEIKELKGGENTMWKNLKNRQYKQDVIESKWFKLVFRLLDSNDDELFEARFKIGELRKNFEIRIRIVWSWDEETKKGYWVVEYLEQSTIGNLESIVRSKLKPINEYLIK